MVSESSSLVQSSPSDSVEFSTLPEELRQDVSRRMVAMGKIEEFLAAGMELTKACRQAAVPYVGIRGFSARRLGELHEEWVKTRSWRALVDKSRAGTAFWKPTASDTITKRPAFLEHVRALFERDQRGTLNAWRGLLRSWEQWKRGDSRYAIPGYTSCPPADESGVHPAGWSYDNLRKLCGNDQVALIRSRIGTAAAAQFRPPVLRTRVGLHFGELFACDDHEFNLKSNFPGQMQGMRPKGFFALEILSACDVLQSYKPTLWDEREDIKRTLTETDFLWFLVNLLMDVGYRTDSFKTRIVLEHRVTTVSKEIESRLGMATDGQVSIDRSGWIGEEQMASLFDGRRRGNFKFKARREGQFNLIDNYFAALPGQVGKDRHHCPEELHGRDVYNTSLIQAASQLPIEQAKSLQFPILTWSQFLAMAIHYFQLINNRTDHALEGWDACGFCVSEWRLTPTSDWLPADQLNALDPQARTVAEALIRTQPGLSRVRQLSPSEVRQRHAKELRKLPPEMMPILLPPSMARKVTVRQGTFKLDGKEFGPDGIRFLARDRYGRLREGEQYMAYVNPFAPTVMVLCDDQLRVKGTCQPWTPSRHNDLDAIHRAMGSQNQWDSDLRHDQAIRHADYVDEHRRMLAHNQSVIDGESKTDAQRAIEARVSQSKGSLAAYTQQDAPQSAATDAGQETTTEAEDPLSSYV